MTSTPLETLRQWNKNSDRHTKLQYAYGVLSIVTIVIAGLIGLVNYSLGQRLVSVAAFSALLFFTNAIAWALVDAFVVSRLAKRPTKR